MSCRAPRPRIKSLTPRLLLPLFPPLAEPNDARAVLQRRHQHGPVRPGINLALVPLPQRSLAVGAAPASPAVSAPAPAAPATAPVPAAPSAAAAVTAGRPL